MRLIIVSGLSGSGKSIAIRQLEDSGYFCIDNLPANFLIPVIKDLRNRGIDSAAVSIDARSQADFSSTLQNFKELADHGIDIRVLFLTASTIELVQRFSETRRRHPLSQKTANRSDDSVSLQEAIELERNLLSPIAQGACQIDTTGLLPAQLRNWIRKFSGTHQTKLTIAFESFGFKHGIPVAADLVFDVRCLPNPYYDKSLRPFTGKDEPVAEYLRAQPLVFEMVSDIEAFIRKWLPSYIAQNRHYLTIAIGCTGGQHRSVYVAEELGRLFADKTGVIVRHRIIEQSGMISSEKAVQSV